MAEFTGGCACRAIRYVCTGTPKVSVLCHCRDCQHASGSACIAAVIVDSATLRFTTGDPQYYDTRTDEGRPKRQGFCAACGSPLVVRITESPRIVAITVGSFDDPSWFRPTADMWVTSAQPWDSLDPSREKHPTAYHRR